MRAESGVEGARRGSGAKGGARGRRAASARAIRGDRRRKSAVFGEKYLRLSCGGPLRLEQPRAGLYSTSGRVCDETKTVVEKRPYDRPDLADLMPGALKALRRLRGLRSADVAKAMNIAPRTYEEFENGKVRLNVDRVFDFARILGVDPHAILIALEIGSPRFAVNCAQNKLMMVHVTALEAFDAEVGDDLVALDPLTLMEAYSAFYASLTELARKRMRATGIGGEDGGEGG